MTARVKFVPDIDARVGGTEYVITAKSAFGSTYTAILPSCNCDRVPCPAPAGHGKTSKDAVSGCAGRRSVDFCHREAFGMWHPIHVERFVTAVARTFKTPLSV